MILCQCYCIEGYCYIYWVITIVLTVYDNQDDTKLINLSDHLFSFQEFSVSSRYPIFHIVFSIICIRFVCVPLSIWSVLVKPKFLSVLSFSFVQLLVRILLLWSRHLVFCLSLFSIDSSFFVLVLFCASLSLRIAFQFVLSSICFYFVFSLLFVCLFLFCFCFLFFPSIPKKHKYISKHQI